MSDESTQKTEESVPEGEEEPVVEAEVEPAVEGEEEPVTEGEVALAVEDDEEDVAPSFGEIKNEAKEEVGEVVGRVKKAGLTPFRRAVDDVVDRGLDLLDTLADVWAGKKKKD